MIFGSTSGVRIDNESIKAIKLRRAGRKIRDGHPFYAFIFPLYALKNELR